LHNAGNDAKAIAAKLRSFGFQVTEKLDAPREVMNQAEREFKASLQGGDEALFYYSGHGVQINGGNHLLPIDIGEPNDEDEIKDEAFRLQRVLDDLAKQQVRFSLIIIDVCRDYPFQLRTTNKGLDAAGLAPANPARGQMIVYSAGANETALDRLDLKDREPNGVFTRVPLEDYWHGSYKGAPVGRQSVDPGL
jgi:uncharacterized caspase-like protein